MGQKQPAAPVTPDYAAANREGILTDIETLPQRRQIDVASRLGMTGSFDLDGETFSYDFSGLGDADVNDAQLDINRQSAFGQAQDLLDIQSEFGQEFLETSRDQLKASDPIGFALREKLGQSVTTELDSGRALSDGERRGVQQSTRASQAARGNVNGVAAGVQEVMAQSQFGEQRFQQRQQNAAAFLSGTTPLSQFGQLRQAGAGAAPFQSLAGNAVGLDRNAGAAAAAFSQQSFGTQSQVYNTQMSNQSNPWMEGLGMVAGVAGSAFGGR
jgi:hypothetical protein